MTIRHSVITWFTAYNLNIVLQGISLITGYLFTLLVFAIPGTEAHRFEANRSPAATRLRAISPFTLASERRKRELGGLKGGHDR